MWTLEWDVVYVPSILFNFAADVSWTEANQRDSICEVFF